MLLIVTDILLLLGFTLRLTRFVVTDDLGGWLIREPARRWSERGSKGKVVLNAWIPGQYTGPEYTVRAEGAFDADGHQVPMEEVRSSLWVNIAPGRPDEVRSPSWRQKLFSGLDCPFCVGFWLAALTVVSLLVAGGPGADGTLAIVWRVVAGVFTLNWLAAHIGARLGDAGYADADD